MLNPTQENDHKREKWIVFTFKSVPHDDNTTINTPSSVFHRRKSVTVVYDMMGRKWWQTSNFWANCHLKATRSLQYSAGSETSLTDDVTSCKPHHGSEHTPSSWWKLHGELNVRTVCSRPANRRLFVRASQCSTHTQRRALTHRSCAQLYWIRQPSTTSSFQHWAESL